MLLCPSSTLASPDTCPQPPGALPNDMVASLMQLQRHERGNHAVWFGTDGAGVIEVRFRGHAVGGGGPVCGAEWPCWTDVGPERPWWLGVGPERPWWLGVGAGAGVAVAALVLAARTTGARVVAADLGEIV